MLNNLLNGLNTVPKAFFSNFFELKNRELTLFFA